MHSGDSYSSNNSDNDEQNDTKKDNFLFENTNLFAEKSQKESQQSNLIYKSEESTQQSTDQNQYGFMNSIDLQDNNQKNPYEIKEVIEYNIVEKNSKTPTQFDLNSELQNQVQQHQVKPIQHQQEQPYVEPIPIKNRTLYIYQEKQNNDDDEEEDEDDQEEELIFQFKIQKEKQFQKLKGFKQLYKKDQNLKHVIFTDHKNNNEFFKNAMNFLYDQQDEENFQQILEDFVIQIGEKFNESLDGKKFFQFLQKNIAQNHYIFLFLDCFEPKKKIQMIFDKIKDYNNFKSKLKIIYQFRNYSKKVQEAYQLNFLFYFKISENKQKLNEFIDHFIKFLENINEKQQDFYIQFLINNHGDLYLNRWTAEQKSQLSQIFLQKQKLDEEAIQFIENEMENLEQIMIYYLKQNNQEKVLNTIYDLQNGLFKYQQINSLLREIQNYDPQLLKVFNDMIIQNEDIQEQIMGIIKENIEQNFDDFENYPQFKNFIKQDYIFEKLIQLLINQQNFKQFFGAELIMNQIQQILYDWNNGEINDEQKKNLFDLQKLYPQEQFKIIKMINENFLNLTKNRESFIQYANPKNIKNNKFILEKNQDINIDIEKCKQYREILLSTDNSDDSEKMRLNSNSKIIFQMINYFEYELNKEKFYEKINGQNLILLFGGTGAGKSTFGSFYYNYLQHPKTVITNKDGKVKKQYQIFKQGHSHFSETYKPSVEIYNDVYLLDMPGLNENRGVIINIFQALVFLKILRVVQSMKIILVLSRENFEASRGESVKGLFKTLSYILGEQQFLKLSKNFIIVFTKFTEQYQIDCILQEQQVFNNHKQIYDNMEKFVFNYSKDYKTLPKRMESLKAIKEKLDNLQGIQQQELKNLKSFLNDETLGSIIEICEQKINKIEDQFQEKNINWQKIFIEYQKIKQLQSLENDQIKKYFLEVFSSIKSNINNLKLKIFYDGFICDVEDLDKTFKPLQEIVQYLINYPEFGLNMQKDINKFKRQFLGIKNQQLRDEKMIKQLIKQQFENKEKFKTIEKEKKQQEIDHKLKMEQLKEDQKRNDPRNIYQLIDEGCIEIIQYKYDYNNIIFDNGYHDGQSYLSYAVQKKQKQIIEFFLQQNLSFKNNELIKQNVLELISDPDYDLNQVKLRLFQDRLKQPNVQEYYYDNNGNQKFVVFQAVKSNDFELLKFLQQEGFSLNVQENNISLYHYVIEQENMDMFIYLKNQGVQIGTVDSEGFNELMRTVYLKQKKFYDEIKKSFQSDLSKLFRGKSKLGNNLGHLISGNSNMLWVEDVFQNVNINEQNKDQQTIIMRIFQNQNLEALEVLLRIELKEQINWQLEDKEGNQWIDYFNHYFENEDNFEEIFKNKNFRQLRKEISKIQSPKKEENLYICFKENLLKKFKILQQLFGKIDLKKLLEFKDENNNNLLRGSLTIEQFKILVLSFVEIINEEFLYILIKRDDGKALIKILGKFNKIDKHKKRIEKIVNLKYNGVLPLTYAAENENITMLSLLKKFKANPQLTNDDGSKPIDNKLVKQVFESKSK